MRTFKMLDKNYNLIEELRAGKLEPQGALSTECSFEKNVLHMFFKDLSKFPELEVTLFFWDWDHTQALFYKKMIARNGHVKFCISDPTMLFQMELLGIDYLRFCIATNLGECYTCGFMFNDVAQKEETSNDERIVGKIYNTNTKLMVVDYSEKGILTLRINSKKILEKYYSYKLLDTVCTNEELKLLVNLPIIKGIGKVILRSKTTGKEYNNIDAKINKKDDNGLRQILEINIGLRSVPENDDAYEIYLVVNGEYFRADCSQCLFPKQKIQHVNKSNGQNIDVLLVRESDESLSVQVAKKIYPCMLSIVTAVYNTAPFLAEMINSVLNQELKKIEHYVVGGAVQDYSKRIYQDFYELILVDDGSKDGSAEILDDYATLSDRVKVIHKVNGGVSSARNAGIDVAEGKYFNFADSDDKLSLNFISETLSYFEQHYDEMDILTTAIRFFDGLNEEHWSNAKFKKGNRIIDLNIDYKNVLMYVNASLFKAEKIKGVRKFNENLKTAEDINFIYSFFLEDRPMLGLMNSCEYLYRRRSEGEESLIQSSKKDRNRYLEYFTVGMKYLTHTSETRFGEIPRYIQYLIACDIQWRFCEDEKALIAKTVLEDSEFELYKGYVVGLLRKIDIDIIWAQEKIWREHKMYMSYLKYEKKPRKVYLKEQENVQYYYEDAYVVDASSNYVRINYIETKGNKFFIEGALYSFEKDSIPVIKINNEYYEMEEVKTSDFNKYSFGEIIFYGKHFKFEYTLNPQIKEYELVLYEKIDGFNVLKKDVRYGDAVPLSSVYSDSYVINDGWVIRKEGTIRVRPLYLNKNTLMESYGLNSFLRYEKDFLRQVTSNSKLDENVLNKALQLRDYAKQLIANRKIMQNNKIWLLSDGVSMAGNNAEALFIYLNQMKLEEIDAYFVIDRDCADYYRLQQYGNVVARGSDEHILLHFLAEYVISSHLSESIMNPIASVEISQIFIDMVHNPKFIFLNHGIVQHDINEWIERLKLKVAGFVSVTKREYDCMNTDKEVWVTGLPRYDRLYHNEKRYVTIMPTLRSYLCRKEKHGMVMKSGFRETDYYKFYNDLINNKRLLDAAEELNYKIAFKPHPAVLTNLSEFNHDPRVKFWGEEVLYNDAFAESNLCVTDYSSLVMDFAYLRKPVVYVHFDKEKFFENNCSYKEGQFDYAGEGFGEITYDLDSLIDLVIEYMKNDCQLKEIYRNRIDGFFEYDDQKNCERVYSKIIEQS